MSAKRMCPRLGRTGGVRCRDKGLALGLVARWVAGAGVQGLGVVSEAEPGAGRAAGGGAVPGRPRTDGTTSAGRQLGSRN